ncbi:MAG: hypothetical protein KBS74_05600 [Clostridiales bacterium]|nr:hypothetical protein [Candidatus Cacconaster stercorequi]
MSIIGSIFFYGIIIIGAITIIGLTIYRIDWARHPEKYQKLVEETEKEEYWKKKRAEQRAALKRAEEKEKARQKEAKKQKRSAKINQLTGKKKK